MARPILVVEDEPELAVLLTDILEAEGFTVTLATGAQAVERIEEVNPGAVVMDYSMPGLSGADVMDRLRAARLRAVPPVLLVTGLRNAEELAREIQADAYLRKPFELSDFVAIVRRLTASGAVG